MIPEVSVCIPTLDATTDRCVTCLRSIRATLNVTHEVVIVDNGGAPQGFSAPVNAALRAARAKYLVVCNDDVEVLPGWWPPLRAALDGGVPVVFPETVGGFMRYDFAAWCFAMTRATRVKFSVRHGEFYDRSMMVWYQDTDLHRRLVAVGTPPMCVHESNIKHGVSQTLHDPAQVGWVHEQVERDRVTFEEKWQ